MKFLDLQAQYAAYRPAIDSRIAAILQHGQFILGPEVGELEAALARYVGVQHCLTVASGTMSLEIALRALDIGPGHEVITTPFTWISTAEVVSLVGARPVFVDIEPATFNLDPHLLEAAITPRTAAIMPVSLFGQMPDLEAIEAIAARHGLPVIEDAAQSFGASRNGRSSCAVGRVGSTSFFPSKPFGCYGDGGALFTNDSQLARRMQAIRTHGGIVRDHHELVGTNGRFDTLQAGILLAKLPHLNDEITRRQRLAARYTEALKDRVVTPPTAPGNTHVYAQYTLRTPHRAELREALAAAGIPTAVYYPTCLHQQPVFASLGLTAGAFPEAERASREVLSVPLHPFLTGDDQEKVIHEIDRFLNHPPG